MGFLSNVVGTVVTVVENATGNQGSGAGDWTEQQAGQAEDAADNALAAVADATGEALDFGKLFGQRLEGKLGNWLLGTGGRLGLNGPSVLDLASTLGLVVDVLELTTRRVEGKLEQMLPAPVVSAGARARGVASLGPAAWWAEVKAELQGGKEVLGTAGGWVRDKGQAVGGKVGSSAGKVGQWAGDKGGAIAGKVGDTAGKLGRWGDDKVAHARALDKLHHWGDRMGTRVNDTSPAETVRELARRADAERARMLDALRRAAASVPAPPQTGRPAWHPVPAQRAHSHRPESVELRRLTVILVAATPAGAGRVPPEAARHMAAAAEAAARSAVLQTQLLLWLAAIKRLSRQRRQRKPH